MWTLVAYDFYRHKNILVTGFLVPAILFCFFKIVIVYIKNNYSFLENIDQINYGIDARNKRVDVLRKKARVLRDQILEKGAETVYGAENERLVKKVMDLEVDRRNSIKLAKSSVKNDEDEEK